MNIFDYGFRPKEWIHSNVHEEKSRSMFNKSKSPETFISETSNTEHLMELLLTEQRHQRADLATIKRQLHTIISSAELQKQVDDYFDEQEQKTPETSPQTDIGDK